MVVVAVSLPVMTTARLQVWSDESRLWADAVAHSPEKPRPWLNLGRAYALDGATDLAIWATERGLARSRDPRRQRVDGPMRVTHVALLNLAMLHAEAGRYDDALRLTVQIQPRADPWVSLVTMLEAQWQAAQARGSPSLLF